MRILAMASGPGGRIAYEARVTSALAPSLAPPMAGAYFPGAAAWTQRRRGSDLTVAVCEFGSASAPTAHSVVRATGQPSAQTPGRRYTQEAMVITLDTLHAQRTAILEVAQRRGARNVRVFGSVARGEAEETSDLDLLVDMEPGRSLLDLSALERELSELLGCRVEV